MARTIYQDGAEDTESNPVSYEAVSLGGPSPDTRKQNAA